MKLQQVMLFAKLVRRENTDPTKGLDGMTNMPVTWLPQRLWTLLTPRPRLNFSSSSQG